MTHRLNPDFAKGLSVYGAETVSKCFNCGNCTAICAHSDEQLAIPRHYVRLMQIGLDDEMRASMEPWLCYYCGDCSDTCPRQAEPAELMMSARRWLTAAYDWTGLSRLMYGSAFWEVALLAILALVVLGLFTLPGGFGFRLLAQHPEARQAMDLQSFAPKEVVHWGDLTLAALLVFFLLSNAARMWSFVMRGVRAPLGAYIMEFKELVIHLLTQKKWAKCDPPLRLQWIRHIFLVTGYGTMFILVVVFLPWFQIDGRQWHWTSLLGYYGTVMLLAVVSWMMLDRLGKQQQIHKHSHLSDWLFLWLLLGTAVTGIVMHLCRLLGLPLATYWAYTIHLMIAVPMLAVEVPFGKWAHLLYRPLAIYLTAVRERARSMAPAGKPVLATN